MNHLSEAQLVDLAEGRAGQAEARHLEVCAACRQEVASLRSVIESARVEPVPEPSPIFWDQLSSRVSHAIDAAPAQPRWTWLRPGSPWRVAAATATILLVAVLAWHLLDLRQKDAVPTTAPADQAAVQEPSVSEGSIDAWDALELAAQELGWEDAQSIGIGAHPGAAEPFVDQLTDDERLELARLIEQEMRRIGA